MWRRVAVDERQRLPRYRLRRRLTTTVLCIAAASVGPALAAERVPLLSEARTRGPYYADLEAPGALDEALRVVSDGSEVVLLHGNEYRARMLINLVAQLNGIGIDHILLLSFDRWLCDALRRAGRVGCVHSSYLTGGGNDTSGGLAARADAWELAPRYRAWITKLYYMRLMLEKSVRILALDSDVVVGADPYESLRGVFGQYSLITAYDTKGGFANINVGVLYLQNVSIGGPVHGLFLEFEKRVRDGLALNPPETAGKRQWFAPRLFWDQNVFNKVLLSAIVERRVYLPDGSDDAWTRTHQGYLRLAGSPDSWERPDIPIKPAPELGVYEPWFSASPEYRQRTLRLVAGAPATARSERILLSPPWLIAADNALGHRYKHWLYGASPTPSMLLHFVCVATGEASRILPMRLFGAYHEEAVLRELRGLQEEAARSGGQTLQAKLAEEVASAVPGPLLALWPGSLDAPMKPHGWKRLNVMHTILGGLAVSAERRAVLPALNCTGTKDRFIEPGNLPSRCFWHVHSKRGVGCVFRLGGCSEAVVAPPTELAVRERQLGKRPPSVTLDLRSLSFAAASGALEPPALKAAVAKLDGARDAIRAYDLTGSPVVRLVLKLPPNPTKEMLKALDAAIARARIRDGVESFRSRCRELTDRSKKRRRECTNTC